MVTAKYRHNEVYSYFQAKYINIHEAETNIRTRLVCYPLGLTMYMQIFQIHKKPSESLNEDVCPQVFCMRNVQLEI